MELFSVPLVDKPIRDILCVFDTFIMNFWNPTIISTSEHIFYSFMIDIKMKYCLYYIDVKNNLNHFILVTISGRFPIFW